MAEIGGSGSVALRRPRIVIVVVLIAASGFVILWAISFLVWIPDVFSPDKWIDAGSVILPNSDRLHIVQRWNRDFYLTLLAVTDPSQEHLKYLGFIGPDRPKIWNCTFSVNEIENKVVVEFEASKPEVVYDWAINAARIWEGPPHLYLQRYLDTDEDWQGLERQLPKISRGAAASVSLGTGKR